MEPIIISASFFQEQPSLGVLGRTGEHEARRISFDCGEVLKTWPEATILCVCRRPCDTAAYPIPLTADGTTYTMPLTSRETAAAGTIKLELRAVRDDIVLKSAIFYGRILLSLNGQKDAPGNPLSDALNRLESTIADAQTLADEIRQKLDNGEFIGERGPQGEPGERGPQGDKGDKGDPGADGSDATVTAENIQSALGYAPGKALTSENYNGQIENLSPDKITFIVNNFWRYGNACQFVLQFDVSETMVFDYGASIAKLPFTSAMRCWLNNSTDYFIDNGDQYIRRNGKNIHSGNHVLSGMYITNDMATDA